MGPGKNNAVEIPDMTGKVIVVTGGNTGLGAETIRQLLPHNPKRVFLCARTPSKAHEFVSTLGDQAGLVEIVQYDLSSLQSTRSAASYITKATECIDLLVLNAGVSGTAPDLTSEGYEWQFGVNYLSYALFVQLLMPLMLPPATHATATSDVRIVFVASEAAKIFAPSTGIVLDQVKTDMAAYGGMARYGQSKLAGILFARKFAQLYPSITCVSVHPGLVRTENFSKANGAGWFKNVWRVLLWTSGVSVVEGVKSQLWAATAENVVSGKFYFPVGKEDTGGKFGQDNKKIDELWNWTAQELLAHGGTGWPKSI